MSKTEYRLFNVLCFALLFCFFLYLIIGGNTTSRISCQILKETGEACSSCGLTRDFKSFSRFDFSQPINQNSLFVFAWFVFQFIGRGILSALPMNTSSQFKKLDLFLTVITVMAVFLPFWM